MESHYGITTNCPRRIIAGHSSGGFGALRLGMLRPDLFDGVIALSPDSDFPFTHLPLVKLPGVTNASLAQINSCMTPRMTVPFPKDGDLIYALGLSAAYAPAGPGQPGRFQWLYDANGRFRKKVWQLWLDNDPLTIVRQNLNAFRANQSVYLDGAAHDQFGANVGAGKIYDVLRDRAARCTFYEPPGRTTIISRNGCSADLPGFSNVPSRKLSKPACLTLPPPRPNFKDMGSQPVVLFAGGEG